MDRSPPAVGELLAVEGYIELRASEAHRLGGEIGEQLLAGGALRHVREFVVEAQVLFGEDGEQVSKQPRVEFTGGAASREDAAHVHKHNRGGLGGHDADAERGAGRTGVAFGEYLSGPDLRHDVPVAPEVFLDNVDGAAQHHSDSLGAVAETHHELVPRIFSRLHRKAAEHRLDLTLLYTFEER